MRVVLLSLVVVVAICAVFSRAGSMQFVSFDDPHYVSENTVVQQGLTADGFAWAFTTRWSANWHPLTWLSHMLDIQLFGLDAGAHHLVNVGLHAAVAVLFLTFLLRCTGAAGPALFAALLFALHPLRMESVAWVSERKDLLAGLFWMLTLHAWVSWVSRPSATRYALVLLAFAAGLMSKPVIVTLPFVLLLLDIWPLSRTDVPWRRRVIEKTPLFAMAAASCAVTWVVQQAGGAMHMASQLDLGQRLLHAPWAYVGYLRRFFWPVGLSSMVPHEALDSPDGTPWGAALGATALLVLISVLALRRVRTQPALLVGWLWMLGVMVPMIGVVQVGLQGLADRYTYLPMAGLGMGLAFGLGPLLARLGAARTLLATAVLIACGMVSWKQSAHWMDSQALYTQVLAVDPDHPVAHYNLGLVLQEQGDIPAAIAQYREGLETHPDDVNLRVAMAVLLLQEMAPGAEQAGREALTLAPDEPRLSALLGQRLLEQMRLDESLPFMQRWVALEPDEAQAHGALGRVRAARGEWPEALGSLRQACLLDEQNASLGWDLARALLQAGATEAALEEAARVASLPGAPADAGLMLAQAAMQRGSPEDARRHLSAVLEADPRQPDASYLLGLVLYVQGDAAGAVAALRIACAAEPPNVDALAALSELLSSDPDAQVRNGEEALSLARRGVQMTQGEHPVLLAALGAAYAELGDFDSAMTWAQRAIQKAPSSSARWQQQLALYLQHEPYRRR